MPSANFSLTRLSPTTATGANLAPTAPFRVGVMAIADPGNPGYVQVPDLATMRQAGSSRAKHFTNIATYADGNGHVADDDLGSLSGGVMALRAYTTPDGVATFNPEAALLPATVTFQSGHTGAPVDLLANSGAMILVYQPVAPLDPSQQYELLYSAFLPYVVVSNGGEVG